MINQHSIEAVANSVDSAGFVLPDYERYCFAGIPDSIGALYSDSPLALPSDVLEGVRRPFQHVVLLFIDGFGWSFFERYLEEFPFLRRFVERGVASKITSMFPSTTAAHVTSIHTGLPVGKSGVYEWFYYEPRLDAVIAPLRFSFASDVDSNTLLKLGADPRDFFPTTTIYQTLGRQGVRSYVFQGQETASSPFSSVVFTGAEVCPFVLLRDGLRALVDVVLSARQPTYSYFYISSIDSAGHRFGPESPHLDKEVRKVMTQVDRFLVRPLLGKAKDTLLMVVADHGHTAVNPDSTVYLNEVVPEIVPKLRRNKLGHLLVPAGSARDFFLHVEEGQLESVVSILRTLLNGRAEIRRTSDLVASGIFGDVGPELQSRVGDVAILPFGGESVWWRQPGIFEQRFRGHHGGLTPDEMETPLLALPLD